MFRKSNSPVLGAPPEPFTSRDLPMSKTRLVLAIVAAAVLGTIGFIVGGNAMNQALGRLVGVGIGAGLGLVAGFVIKVDDKSAEKHEQTSKAGRAIIVGILFGFVGAIIGAIWSQVGPVGGAAQYGDPGSPVRIDLLPAYLGSGGLLGVVAGATVGVLSVRRGNGDDARNE